MPNVLVVDDEAQIRDLLRHTLTAVGFDVYCAESGERALALAREHTPDLVLADLRMPRLDGIETTRRLQAEHGSVPVMLMSGFTPTAHELNRALGAPFIGFLAKPFREPEVVARVVALLAPVGAEDPASADGPIGPVDRFDDLIGACPAMRRVYELISLYAAAVQSVLITGESGTGKELAARAIHAHSPRRDRPFLATNCAALGPPDLLESELFGHEAGAFTGAGTRTKGLFEAADGGTVFLDEFAEMALPAQAKLLRVIEDGEVTRLGSHSAFRVDVRVTLATNANLDALVAAGQLREDLLYRVRALELPMPALRERGEDVGLLLDHFLACEGADRGGQPIRVLPEVRESLLAYRWPGNVRELRNIVASAAVLSGGGPVGLQHLPARVHTGRVVAGPGIPSRASVFDGANIPTPGVPPEDSPAAAARLPEAARRHRDAFERDEIQAALVATGGNQSKAAELLGICRQTIRRKLRGRR
jgi:two-component system NtrC family response regulator